MARGSRSSVPMSRSYKARIGRSVRQRHRTQPSTRKNASTCSSDADNMNRRSRDIGDDAVRIVPLDHENKLRFQAKFGDPWVRREDFPRSKRQLDCSYAPQCDDSLSSCETLLDEGTEGAEDAVAIRVYRRRFWILLVFSAVSFCQYCAWNTFGPIAMTSKLVFDWSNTEIAILASMDPITYLFTMLLFSWLMDAKGLRLSMLISVGFMFLGTGFRCVTSNSNYAFWSICAGQLLNGLAGPVTQAGPTLLSAAWFPPKQRTTATAVAALCGSLGVAMSFVIGPTFVRDIQSDVNALTPAKANLSANLSSLLNKYQDQGLPLTDSIYTDAVHYWPLDRLDISVRDTQLEHGQQKRAEVVKTLRDFKGGMDAEAFGGVHNPDGVVNKSIATDGQNGWVNMGSFTNTCSSQPALCQSSGFSVALWIKYQKSDGPMLYYLGTSASKDGHSGFLMFQDFGYDSHDHLALKVENGSMLWKRSFDVPRDSWTHVAFTWDAREGLVIYTNGTATVRDSLGQKTGRISRDNSVLSLGRPYNEAVFSRAAYDEIAVWYRKLAAEEVGAIHRRTSPFKRTHDLQREMESLLSESRTEIMMLLYIEFGVIAFLFVVVIVYFPDKPPLPPSKSATVQREDFGKGAKQIARNKQFWTLGLVYGVTTGVYSGWGASLAVNLSTFNISQGEAGWIGFYATLAGIGSGLLLARCADLFGGRMKALLLVLFVGSASCFLWFSLLCLRMIPFDDKSLYKSSILGGFFVSGTIPLFYELTVESTYPVAEGVTTGILTLINNTFTVAFLVILTIPSVGTVWMNWCMFAACAGCIPVLLAFRENYRRLNVDGGKPIAENGTSSPEKGEEQAEDDPRIPDKTLKTPLGSFLSLSKVDDVLSRLHKSRESRI